MGPIPTPGSENGMIDVDMYTSPYSRSTPAPRLTSRRAKKIESQLVKQIVILIAVTLLLAFLFFRYVIPSAIKLISGNAPIQQESTANLTPPLVPVLSALATATNSATLQIKGYSQKGNQVVILNNSQEVKRADVAEDGSFSSELTLEKGQNSITTYAIAQNQQQSNVSPNSIILFDQEAPKLDISEPKDGQSISGNKNKVLTIKGNTEENAKMYLNDLFVFVKSDGSFATSIQLKSGGNDLNFRAVDVAGNTAEKKITVQFSE